MCVCGGGGGGILVKWEKNAKYLDFSGDCMFGLTLANTYFQFVTNWNFPFLLMLLWNFKKENGHINRFPQHSR